MAARTLRPTSAPRRPYRVLIAEDVTALRDALTDLINDDPDLEVTASAKDTLEAIAMATDSQPDVVLLDVRMPGGGGSVAARRITAASPGTAIVAFSAHSDHETIKAMRAAGACTYLVKGCSPADITAALRSAASLMRTTERI